MSLEHCERRPQVEVNVQVGVDPVEGLRGEVFTPGDPAAVPRIRTVVRPSNVYPDCPVDFTDQAVPYAQVPLSKADVERANKIANDLNHGDEGSMQGAKFQLEGMVNDPNNKQRAAEIIALATQNSPGAPAQIYQDSTGEVYIYNEHNRPADQLLDVGNLANAAVPGTPAANLDAVPVPEQVPEYAVPEYPVPEYPVPEYPVPIYKRHRWGGYDQMRFRFEEQ